MGIFLDTANIQHRHPFFSRIREDFSVFLRQSAIDERYQIAHQPIAFRREPFGNNANLGKPNYTENQ
jgi:hypothetical protein